MYKVAVKRDFIARHFLTGGDWGRENEPHAHHYTVEVIIKHAELDQHGYLVDIVKIESELDKVVEDYRDKLLNDLPEFKGINTSIEHFSRIISDRLLKAIQPPGPGSFTVKLWENEFCWVSYKQDY
jgi:6-pyruvoyltetrahydropterin/6-carboxytetrahydropterin synthase